MTSLDTKACSQLKRGCRIIFGGRKWRRTSSGTFGLAMSVRLVRCTSIPSVFVGMGLDVDEIVNRHTIAAVLLHRNYRNFGVGIL